MRRSAYLRALEEAEKLPKSLSNYPGLSNYNPREMAISAIKQQARLDINALFNSELVSILNWEPSDAQNLESLADKFVAQATEQLNRSGKPSESSGSKGNEEG